jgi:putative lipase involved disintegration of autophagic bodies
VPVGAVFLLAIGLSGLLADTFGRVFGTAFVAGDAPGVTYTAERCAQLLSFEPQARSCEEAAIAHHFGEVVSYRLAAGALGVLVSRDGRCGGAGRVSGYAAARSAARSH